MPEKSVAEPVEPVGEESQASSRLQSCAISYTHRDMGEEVEVESRANEVRSSTHTKAAKGVDAECRANGDEVDVGGVGERRPQPREEIARVNVERRADIDEVGEKQPHPREEAARVDIERRADIDEGGKKRSQARAETVSVKVERQAGIDKVDIERHREVVKTDDEAAGRAPSTDERHICETGLVYGIPSVIIGQPGRETEPNDDIMPFFSFFSSTHVPIQRAEVNEADPYNGTPHNQIQKALDLRTEQAKNESTETGPEGRDQETANGKTNASSRGTSRLPKTIQKTGKRICRRPVSEINNRRLEQMAGRGDGKSTTGRKNADGGDCGQTRGGLR
jgi:hypothetical protein